MNQAWLIFCLILSVALFSGGYMVRGWKDGIEAAHLAEAQQTNTINAENAVIIKEKKAEQITTEVDTSYEDKVKALEYAYSAVGLLDNDTTQHNVPVISGSTCRPDAAACTRKFSPANKAVIVKIAKSNDQYSARLAALQQWIREQSQ